MKIKVNRALLYISCFILFSRCTNLDFLNLKAQGPDRTKTLNGIQYTCKLQLSEVDNNGKDKELQMKQLNIAFVISDSSPRDHIVKEAVFEKESFGGILSYANKELQYDFEIELSGGEKIPCSGVHIESANSIQPVIRISVAFHHPQKEGDIVLVFHDRLFNNGKIKFRFEKEVFESLSQLKI